MKLQKIKLKNDNVIIIDGMNLFHRVYYNFSYLSTKGGYPTGAVFGFFNSLLNIMKITDSNKIIICWESKNNWKKINNSNYKSNRENRFDDEQKMAFHTCLGDVSLLLKAIGILQVRVNQYEADDVIFYLVSILKNNIIVVSGDKDMLQLVNDKRSVVCLRPKKKGLYEIANEKYVYDNFYHLKPFQVPYFLAIAGDTGDNVKGVKGLGAVKARFIISKYKKINSSNVNDIFKVNEKKQFIDSYKMVSAKSISKRMNKLNKKDFIGVNNFNKDEVDEILKNLEIRKYNSIVLKQLYNFEFKNYLLNKILDINNE
jgi:DNA polymerase-1